jgi:hypothetical protein
MVYDTEFELCDIRVSLRKSVVFDTVWVSLIWCERRQWGAESVTVIYGSVKDSHAVEWRAWLGNGVQDIVDRQQLKQQDRLKLQCLTPRKIHDVVRIDIT